MRRGLAVLILCLGSGGAAAGEAEVPLPAYFQESWDAVAAEPLALFTPVRLRHDIAAEDMPEIVRSGVPMPPSRPIVTPTAAAYASLAPVSVLPSPVPTPPVSIPLPIRRPADLDRSLAAAAEEEDPGDKAVPSVPPTKIAMLGALPGAGMAIAALARMEPLAPIAKGSCSVAQPYRVTALGPDGRTVLEPGATLDIAMVQGLVKWEAELQDAARKTLGEPVVALHVAASYDCRTMNHRRRARLSEHAHANAIDISEFETASGRRITVAKDFATTGAAGSFLRQVHANTCEVFQVVLGPGSDGMHENHIHMDLGHWKACR
jgi:hypothetical protein